MAARRRIRMLLASGGAVVVALGVAGCGSADVEGAPVESKSFALSGTTLTIDSDNSDLEIVPADVEDVRVSRQVDGWVFMGDGPDATWRMADGRLTLRLECDALASSCGAVHRIQVPRGVSVTVEDDNGRVTAAGFATPLKIRSDNGDVVVRRATGALDLGSGNGNVVVEDSSASTDVAARTDNGDVRLTLGAVPRRVEAVTDNGSIDIALPRATYDVDGRSDNGDVRIGVPTGKGGGHVVTARSDNGEVTVRAVN
ncbi:hypothetical protein EAO71_12840 [Streptomyces sp. ms191]|uniref:DUF4097 family beta strand repeat-containing protein n=1 Tax=Streptomyces sp. ms191 TaxID=1827978 RepID=UPI0011CD6048|nr:DUF4097 family beta strand repeat-containing protein [Streptomyces sp. ms191]TXS29537.1 hypothetical protein EAO71_12840 [Streptomyces sp. ms191]